MPGPRFANTRWLLAALATLAVSAWADAELVGEELVEALRGGGYNLYFRHAETDWRQDDYALEPGDLRSCDPDEMRQLSDEGRATARALGEAICALGIPVGRVITSPYCRCVETGALMDLGRVQPTTDIMNTRSAVMFGGLEAVAERARRVFATPPEPGTNTVMVAHGNLMRAASSVSLPEAGAAVIEPDGEGGYAIVTELTPSEWRRLAEQYAPKAGARARPRAGEAGPSHGSRKYECRNALAREPRLGTPR